jgi:predicted anti-sigma-YlaC factor YlaD
MLTPVQPTECMQAREAASALLDGELSELETAQLHGHLRVCDECEDYLLQTGVFTAKLRGAALEQPALPAFTVRRRRPAIRLNVAVAAVTILAATGSSFAVGHLLGSSGGAPSATVGTSGSGVSLPQQNEVLGMLRRLRPGRLESGRVIPV